MSEPLLIHGKRLAIGGSFRTRISTLNILHLDEWPGPVDYEAEAKAILAFLRNSLPPGTMAALEWEGGSK